MTYFFLYFLLWNITRQSSNSESQIAIQFHNLCVVVTNKLIVFTFWKPLIHSHSLYKLLELTQKRTQQLTTVVGPTLLGDVASVSAVVCKRMQHLPMSGPTLHRGKDTAHKTFNLETICNSCGPNFWPQQCWKSCADRFDHQPLLARAQLPRIGSSLLCKRIQQCHKRRLQTSSKRGKHCCKML